MRYTDYKHIAGPYGVVRDTAYGNLWCVSIITGTDDEGKPAWFPWGAYGSQESAIKAAQERAIRDHAL